MANTVLPKDLGVQPTPVGFNIPKIRKIKKTGELKRVASSDRESLELIREVDRTCLDPDLKVRKQWQLSTVHMISPSSDVEIRYREKRAEMKELGGGRQQQEVLGFYVCRDRGLATEIARAGIKVNSYVRGVLGDPRQGVYLFRYLDVALLSQRDKRSIFVLVFKVLQGRTRQVPVSEYDTTSSFVKEPTPNFDSHVSQSMPQLTEQITVLCNKSQVYLYEYTDDATPAEYPRQCLPFALLEFLNGGISQRDGSNVAGIAAKSMSVSAASAGWISVRRSSAEVVRRFSSGSSVQFQKEPFHCSGIQHRPPPTPPLTPTDTDLFSSPKGMEVPMSGSASQVSDSEGSTRRVSLESRDYNQWEAMHRSSMPDKPRIQPDSIRSTDPRNLGFTDNLDVHSVNLGCRDSDSQQESHSTLNVNRISQIPPINRIPAKSALKKPTSSSTSQIDNKKKKALSLQDYLKKKKAEAQTDQEAKEKEKQPPLISCDRLESGITSLAESNEQQLHPETESPATHDKVPEGEKDSLRSGSVTSSALSCAVNSFSESSAQSSKKENVNTLGHVSFESPKSLSSNQDSSRSKISIRDPRLQSIIRKLSIAENCTNQVSDKHGVQAGIAKSDHVHDAKNRQNSVTGHHTELRSESQFQRENSEKLKTTADVGEEKDSGSIPVNSSWEQGESASQQVLFADRGEDMEDDNVLSVFLDDSVPQENSAETDGTDMVNSVSQNSETGVSESSVRDISSEEDSTAEKDKANIEQMIRHNSKTEGKTNSISVVGKTEKVTVSGNAEIEGNLTVTDEPDTIQELSDDGQTESHTAPVRSLMEPRVTVSENKEGVAMALSVPGHELLEGQITVAAEAKEDQVQLLHLAKGVRGRPVPSSAEKYENSSRTKTTDTNSESLDKESRNLSSSSDPSSERKEDCSPCSAAAQAVGHSDCHKDSTTDCPSPILSDLKPEEYDQCTAQVQPLIVPKAAGKKKGKRKTKQNDSTMKANDSEDTIDAYALMRLAKGLRPGKSIHVSGLGKNPTDDPLPVLEGAKRKKKETHEKPAARLKPAVKKERNPQQNQTAGKAAKKRRRGNGNTSKKRTKKKACVQNLESSPEGINQTDCQDDRNLIWKAPGSTAAAPVLKTEPVDEIAADDGNQASCSRIKAKPGENVFPSERGRALPLSYLGLSHWTEALLLPSLDPQLTLVDLIKASRGQADFDNCAICQKVIDHSLLEDDDVTDDGKTPLVEEHSSVSTTENDKICALSSSSVSMTPSVASGKSGLFEKCVEMGSSADIMCKLSEETDTMVTTSKAEVTSAAQPSISSSSAERAVSSSANCSSSVREESVSLVSPRHSDSADEASSGSHRKSDDADNTCTGSHRQSDDADNTCTGLHRQPDSTDETNSGSQRCSDSADKMSICSHKLMDNADETSTGSHKQMDSADETSTGSHKQIDSADETSAGSHKQIDNADETSTGSHKQMDSADETSTGSHRQMDNADETSTGSHKQIDNADETSTGSHKQMDSADETSAGSHRQMDNADETSTGSHKQIDNADETSTGSHKQMDSADETSTGSHKQMDSADETNSGSQNSMRSSHDPTSAASLKCHIPFTSPSSRQAQSRRYLSVCSQGSTKQRWQHWKSSQAMQKQEKSAVDGDDTHRQSSDGGKCAESDIQPVCFPGIQSDAKSVDRQCTISGINIDYEEPVSSQTSTSGLEKGAESLVKDVSMVLTRNNTDFILSQTSACSVLSNAESVRLDYASHTEEDTDASISKSHGIGDADSKKLPSCYTDGKDYYERNMNCGTLSCSAAGNDEQGTPVIPNTDCNNFSTQNDQGKSWLTSGFWLGIDELSSLHQSGKTTAVKDQADVYSYSASKISPRKLSELMSGEETSDSVQPMSSACCLDVAETSVSEPQGDAKISDSEMAPLDIVANNSARDNADIFEMVSREIRKPPFSLESSIPGLDLITQTNGQDSAVANNLDSSTDHLDSVTMPVEAQKSKQNFIEEMQPCEKTEELNIEQQTDYLLKTRDCDELIDEVTERRKLQSDTGVVLKDSCWKVDDQNKYDVKSNDESKGVSPVVENSGGSCEDFDFVDTIPEGPNKLENQKLVAQVYKLLQGKRNVPDDKVRPDEVAKSGCPIPSFTRIRGKYKTDGKDSRNQTGLEPNSIAETQRNTESQNVQPPNSRSTFETGNFGQPVQTGTDSHRNPEIIGLGQFGPNFPYNQIHPQFVGGAPLYRQPGLISNGPMPIPETSVNGMHSSMLMAAPVPAPNPISISEPSQIYHGQRTPISFPRAMVQPPFTAPPPPLPGKVSVSALQLQPAGTCGLADSSLAMADSQSFSEKSHPNITVSQDQTETSLQTSALSRTSSTSRSASQSSELSAVNSDDSKKKGEIDVISWFSNREAAVKNPPKKDVIDWFADIIDGKRNRSSSSLADIEPGVKKAKFAFMESFNYKKNRSWDSQEKGRGSSVSKMRTGECETWDKSKKEFASFKKRSSPCSSEEPEVVKKHRADIDSHKVSFRVGLSSDAKSKRHGPLKKSVHLSSGSDSDETERKSKRKSYETSRRDSYKSRKIVTDDCCEVSERMKHRTEHEKHQKRALEHEKELNKKRPWERDRISNQKEKHVLEHEEMPNKNERQKERHARELEKPVNSNSSSLLEKRKHVEERKKVPKGKETFQKKDSSTSLEKNKDDREFCRYGHQDRAQKTRSRWDQRSRVDKRPIVHHGASENDLNDETYSTFGGELNTYAVEKVIDKTIVSSLNSAASSCKDLKTSNDILPLQDTLDNTQGKSDQHESKSEKIKSSLQDKPLEYLLCAKEEIMKQLQEEEEEDVSKSPCSPAEPVQPEPVKSSTGCPTLAVDKEINHVLRDHEVDSTSHRSSASHPALDNSDITEEEINQLKNIVCRSASLSSSTDAATKAVDKALAQPQRSQGDPEQSDSEPYTLNASSLSAITEEEINTLRDIVCRFLPGASSGVKPSETFQSLGLQKVRPEITDKSESFRLNAHGHQTQDNRSKKFSDVGQDGSHLLSAPRSSNRELPSAVDRRISQKCSDPPADIDTAKPNYRGHDHLSAQSSTLKSNVLTVTSSLHGNSSESDTVSKCLPGSGGLQKATIDADRTADLADSEKSPQLCKRTKFAEVQQSPFMEFAEVQQSPFMEFAEVQQSPKQTVLADTFVASTATPKIVSEVSSSDRLPQSLQVQGAVTSQDPSAAENTVVQNAPSDLNASRPNRSNVCSPEMSPAHPESSVSPKPPFPSDKSTPSSESPDQTSNLNYEASASQGAEFAMQVPSLSLQAGASAGGQLAAEDRPLSLAPQASVHKEICKHAEPKNSGEKFSSANCATTSDSCVQKSEKNAEQEKREAKKEKREAKTLKDFLLENFPNEDPASFVPCLDFNLTTDLNKISNKIRRNILFKVRRYLEHYGARTGITLPVSGASEMQLDAFSSDQIELELRLVEGCFKLLEATQVIQSLPDQSQTGSYDQSQAKNFISKQSQDAVRDGLKTVIQDFSSAMKDIVREWRGRPHQRMPTELLLCDEYDQVYTKEGVFMILLVTIPKKPYAKLLQFRQEIENCLTEIGEAACSNKTFILKQQKKHLELIRIQRLKMMTSFAGSLSSARVKRLSLCQKRYALSHDHLLQVLGRESVEKMVYFRASFEAIQHHLRTVEREMR